MSHSLTLIDLSLQFAFTLSTKNEQGHSPKKLSKAITLIQDTAIVRELVCSWSPRGPCGPRRLNPSGWASECWRYKAALWNEVGTYPSSSPLVHVCFGHELSRLRRGLSLDEMWSGPGPFHRGVCNFNKPYYEVVSTEIYGNNFRLAEPVTQRVNLSLHDPCKFLNMRRSKQGKHKISLSMYLTCLL